MRTMGPAECTMVRQMVVTLLNNSIEIGLLYFVIFYLAAEQRRTIELLLCYDSSTRPNIPSASSKYPPRARTNHQKSNALSLPSSQASMPNPATPVFHSPFPCFSELRLLVRFQILKKLFWIEQRRKHVKLHLFKAMLLSDMLISFHDQAYSSLL